MEETYQRSLKTTRFRFFSDALLLKTLSAPDSLRELESIRKSIGIKQRKGKNYYGLVNGYKVAVATPFYSLLDSIINSPSLVGLDIDYRLAEWWGWGREAEAEGISTRAAFTFPESDFANLVFSLHDLLMQLPKSDTWQLFQEVMSNAHILGETLHEAALGGSVSWHREEIEDLDAVEALRRGAIERVDEYLEGGTMSSVLAFVWRDGNPRNISAPEVEDDYWWDTESHLDPPPSLLARRQKRRGGNRGNWGNGLWAAVSVGLNQLGFEAQEDTDASALFGICIASPGQMKAYLRSTLDDNWPSRQYGLNEPPGIPLDRLITVNEPMPVIDPEKRLRVLVGNEEGRILGSYPIDGLDFPKLLEVVVSSIEEEHRIEVVRAKHPAPDSSTLTWYSLAIRIPRFGLFSNASKWWVFYKAHGYGPSADSEVYVAERLINESLAKRADRINLIELEHIGERFFLNLFEPPAWREVFNSVRGMVNANADLRGVVPELLATEMLARRHYRNIRTSFKPAPLGGLEVDSLGIRLGPGGGGECLVMEIKGQSSTDEVLAQELEDFARKVRTLKNHLPELAQEVGYDGEISRVSGTFVSMGYPGLEYDDPDVTFLDFDGFVSELRSVGIPSRLINLLQPTRVYRMINELTTNAWFKANDPNEAVETEEQLE